MLKRTVSILLLAGMSLNLTGCASWWQKHNFVKKHRTEYLRSQESSPLRVPAGLAASGIGDDYVIQSSAAPAPAAPIGILPPDSLADKLKRGVVTKDALKNASKLADAKPAVNTTTVNQTGSIASASMVSDNTLPLNQTVAQAWSSVGAALKRAGYKIAVSDEKIATYYILDMHATDERVTKSTPICQVKLQSGADGNAYVTVTEQNNNPASAAASQQILTNLKNALAGKGSSSFTQMLAPVKHWFKEAF